MENIDLDNYPPRWGKSNVVEMTTDEIIDKFGEILSEDQIQHLKDLDKTKPVNPEDLKIPVELLMEYHNAKTKK